MAGTIVEWLAFLLLILLFVGAVIAEVKWLVKKGWATSGRATGFVLTTDLVGFGIGMAIVMFAVLIMFMMVMGPSGQGSNVPEIVYVIVSIVAFIATPLTLFIVKRLCLMIFKIQAETGAWKFSLIAAVLVSFVVFIPPPLLLYLVVTLWKL